MNGQFARAYLGIGEVLVELRAEFPDISVSKIRFLESEGLISPARSPSGYRRFGPADVNQLRFILTAQRDQYLPLRVIKERLSDGPAAERPQEGARAGGHSAATPGASQSEMVTARELMDSAGIDSDQLAELEAHGLIRRVGRLYGQDALDVAATIAALASYGVQARHLRQARTAADKDISLIEQLVAPTLRQRSPQAIGDAASTASQIAALLLRLHRAMIESALAEAGLLTVDLPETDAPPVRSGVSQPEPGGSGAGRPGASGASA
jgi:DNA-binding transcriptional MerR regulator